MKGWVCELPYNYITNANHHYKKQSNFVKFQQIPNILHLPAILITKDDRFKTSSVT